MGLILGPDGQPMRSEEIRFYGGPFDDKTYSGDQIIPIGHIGVWPENRDLGGTSVQLLHHIYKMMVRNGKRAWVFQRTEEGIVVHAKEQRIPRLPGPRRHRERR